MAQTTSGPADGGSVGDPHFKTWAGKWYDYHGICDLVLLKLDDFANGQGTDIVIRTAGRGSFSYIETAAIRIGQDILEVTGWGAYAVNGVEHADLPMDLGGFKFEKWWSNTKKPVFMIHLDGGEHIKISTKKELVSVKVENATQATFGASVGLMGSYNDGIWFARDGETVMTDPIAFGEEWQVLNTEANLFEMDRFPQFPQRCQLSQATRTGRRRLGEAIAQEAAEEACAHWDDEHMDLCVFDVLATGDLELAESGDYF
ncbi:expressed unknown protein [Seminavis robusta]|uniref:VWFD domain-containing protein n=1 Tax=Seminavis robusta TaxID=568900 RepID=A0A9N8HEI1_9STRA|nr:expressed unknown protein [Seminavis robusta]|eukprot:Sro388_g132321.1  (259) ;mRNA; r:30101-30877